MSSKNYEKVKLSEATPGKLIQRLDKSNFIN